MKIDLGCGEKKKADHFGIDIKKFSGVDLVHDCNEPIPLDDNIADEIYARNFLEFIDADKKVHIMNEIWRLLKPRGIFICEVMSTDGRGAFENPFHKSYWNENSFLYFSKDEYRERYDIEAKFDIITSRTMPKDRYQIAHTGVKLRAVKPKIPIKPKRYTIICASNNEKTLQKDLLSSKNLEKHQLIIQRNCKNVPQAYNEATKSAEEDIIIYVHHDVFLPENFFSQLDDAISNLGEADWGVLGVAGCLGKDRYGYLLNRTQNWGSEKLVPHEVETLDELILIVKKGTVVFDENIPSTHHMFGADICMQCKDQGKTNYAILAYCEHRCALHTKYPKDFYDSADYIGKKWSKYLPITTTCTTVKK